MNETIDQLPSKNLELYTQYKFIDSDLHTSFFENHFIQLQKYDSPVSQLIVTTPLPPGHFPLIFEEKITVTNTKDFTES